MKRYSLLTKFVLIAAGVGLLAWLLVQRFDTTGQKSDGVAAKAKGSGVAAKSDEPLSVRELRQRIRFDVSTAPKEVKRGETVQVVVKAHLTPGCYTYAMTVRTPEQEGVAVSTFKAKPVDGLQPLAPIKETEPTLKSFFEHKSDFTWEFDLLVNPDAKTGLVRFPFAVAIQVCNESCVSGELPLLAEFNVATDEPVTIQANLAQRAKQSFPPPAVEKSPKISQLFVGSNDVKIDPFSPLRKAPPVDWAKVEEQSRKVAKGTETPTAAVVERTIPRDYQASIERVQKQILAPDAMPVDGLMAFVLTGMFWGFVSLITPCVFPMIPITVSFFLKQSEKEHHKPVTMALVYCGTIIIVLTIAAAALLNFFRVLSISPVMNFGLGLLFVFFALSLFGMYEIELPNFLARYTSERESKGGMIGTIFMALTFTIISFACVAPFLGGFGGTADTATRPFLAHPILGGLAFATTFASPFFILALFPTLLKAMPKSGAWLNSVKVVMGFLELAAALKFFRAGELVLPSPLGLFTFDLVLGLWIALCILCGLYLLGFYRLPHDSPVDHLTVPRMLFAFAFLGLGLYLMPALFTKTTEGEQPRPSGVVFAWIYSFLLPDPPAAKGVDVWSPDLENSVLRAREYAKRTGKPKLVFIDFTGEICANCKLNENNVFNKAEIQQLFKAYELVKLYCDRMPLKYYGPDDRAEAEAGRRVTDAKANYDFEAKVFNDATQPVYAILEPLPDGKIKIVAKYNEGLIRNEQEFAEFLRGPQKAIGATVASR